MADRRIYIDKSPGKIRGAIALGGRPERLIIDREGDAYPRLGARSLARVVMIDRTLGLAMLDLGEGKQASLRLKADRPPPVQGQTLDVEIAIEPQGGKPAVARTVSGDALPITASAAMETRSAELAPGARTIQGPDARAFIDEAEEEALAVEHALPGGGSLAIEPTRALVAVDIDLGSGGGRDAKRAARQANMNGLVELARLLRLKALGGLVVVDLVGRGHDGPALARAAQGAFAADQPGVVLGPITRFGTLELALPRRHRPIHEILSGPDGRPTDRSLVQRLLRAVERQASANPGARLTVACAPSVAAAAFELAKILAGIIGARFEIIPDPALARERWDISVR